MTGYCLVSIEEWFNGVDSFVNPLLACDYAHDCLIATWRGDNDSPHTDTWV